MWSLCLLSCFLAAGLEAVQFYRPPQESRSRMERTVSSWTTNQHQLHIEGQAFEAGNLVVSPLQVVPELKESYLCTIDGDQHLLDHDGFYLPAYSSSAAFNGHCRFEDFEEERVIGRGAFGQVYRAVHKPTGRVVAIKELTRPVEFRLIRREECIQHSLHSPLMTRHYCTISEEGYIAFVMELVEGTTLYKARRRSENLPIVSIAAQIVLMMEYLHDRYIMYRDLKPENLMYNPRKGTVKLIDFGLAHRLDGPNAQTTGQSGTPPFMAPEIIASINSRYSYPADWYTLGLVIYELIGGRNPFDNIRDTSILQRHIAEGFECNLPDTKGCHLILKLTNHDPTLRWGHSISSRRRIRRHPWFAGIPWAEFEAGNFSVRIPSIRSPGGRTSSRRQLDIRVASKKPLRETIQPSDEAVMGSNSHILQKSISDDTSATTTAGPDSTAYEPIRFNPNGGGSVWRPPIMLRNAQAPDATTELDDASLRIHCEIS